MNYFFNIEIKAFFHSSHLLTSFCRSIVEAIIDSEWWESGFIGKNGHHCENFRMLVMSHPELALKVQEKCVERVSNLETRYDFRLYNDNYYIPAGKGDIFKPINKFESVIYRYIFL